MKEATATVLNSSKKGFGNHGEVLEVVKRKVYGLVNRDRKKKIKITTKKRQNHKTTTPDDDNKGFSVSEPDRKLTKTRMPASCLPSACPLKCPLRKRKNKIQKTTNTPKGVLMGQQDRWFPQARTASLN